MCIFINGVINVTMRVVWCPLVKPALVGILSIIQSLASLAGDSNTANNIQSINDALRLYEDIPTCQSHFNDMRCNFFDQSVPTNSSLFLPQSTPTICWSNDIGGGTLAGQVKTAFPKPTQHYITLQKHTFPLNPPDVAFVFIFLFF